MSVRYPSERKSSQQEQARRRRLIVSALKDGVTRRVVRDTYKVNSRTLAKIIKEEGLGEVIQKYGWSWK